MAEILRREKTTDPRGREIERNVIRCDCRREVLCYGFTNTCDCGADYNMSGDRLAPREQWGEETGESPTDVANITGYEDFNF
jgi:hypothetical protein